VLGSRCARESVNIGSVNAVPTNEPSDEALFLAYTRGDRAAFRALFQRYEPLLTRVMRRGMFNDAIVGDLVQQTFLQVHRARLDFDTSRKFRPWLLTIAMNLKRQHFRTLKRRPEDPTELTDRVVPAVPAYDPTRTDDARKLHEALARLPDNQREVLVLHWLEGLPMNEVGDVLGASRSAVKVRAHRAYERLRTILESMGVTSPGGPA
jgi:RNA polymerase sigma factor (sigma-70 family)